MRLVHKLVGVCTLGVHGERHPKQKNMKRLLLKTRSDYQLEDVVVCSYAYCSGIEFLWGSKNVRTYRWRLILGNTQPTIYAGLWWAYVPPNRFVCVQTALPALSAGKNERRSVVGSLWTSSESQRHTYAKDAK